MKNNGHPAILDCFLCSLVSSVGSCCAPAFDNIAGIAWCQLGEHGINFQYFCPLHLWFCPLILRFKDYSPLNTRVLASVQGVYDAECSLGLVSYKFDGKRVDSCSA